MRDELLHTPDGVRDIYNGECKSKLAIQEKLHQTLLSFGYHDIQTPTFEFFDIFSHQVGTTPSKDLYKFFDKEGNTLVLRPDFTPSIARSAVKYFVDENMPVKLCYVGNTYINHTDYKGRLKESTQCGAELIGDASIAADAEILAMTAEALRSCGLYKFQISVGHARFFTGLIEAAKISEEQEETLRELISNKNFFGVEEFINTLDIHQNLKALFGMLGSFNFDGEELNKAKEYAKDYTLIYSAICELEQIGDYLKAYGIDKYVSFEPGIISNYHYYTGIIFSAYTFGTGEAIVKGGRYDKLLSHFGNNKPASGFAIYVDQLMAALKRQKIEVETTENNALIIFCEENRDLAIRKATMMRKKGIMVNLLLFDSARSKEDYFAYASQNHISHVEFV